jgi:hypothetical protein
VGDVGHRHHDKTAGVGRKRSLDALLHREERQWIFLVDAVRVADRNARLADTSAIR